MPDMCKSKTHLLGGATVHVCRGPYLAPCTTFAGCLLCAPRGTGLQPASCAADAAMHIRRQAGIAMQSMSVPPSEHERGSGALHEAGACGGNVELPAAHRAQNDLVRRRQVGEDRD